MIPKKYICRVIVLSGFVFCVAGLAASEKPSGDAASGLRCVRWTQEARFKGLGYNHLVHLHNTCKKAATCSVQTDVNPDAKDVLLAPDKKTTVTTFLGSPSSVFQAKVSCRAK